MPNPQEVRNQNTGFIKAAIRLKWQRDGNFSKKAFVAFVCNERGLSERTVKEYLNMFQELGVISCYEGPMGGEMIQLEEKQTEVQDFGATN